MKTHSTLDYLLGVLSALVMMSLILLAGCDTQKPPAAAPEPAKSVVAFTASWCGPCQRAKPALSELAAAGVEIHEIDIDERPGLARGCRVRSVPTFIVMAGSREIARTHGVSELRRLLGDE